MPTNRKFFHLLGVLFAATVFGQEPGITEVLNNYSLNTVRSTSIGIAQGAIFIVKGARLSDSTSELQTAYPLQSSLNGVRIRITVGTVDTYALMYYALPTQLAGILPSSTPVGAGTVVVENNGRNSRGFPVNIARSSFGTLTVSGNGKGAAGVHDENYRLLSATNSTNPGKAIVFYGSGLGGTTRDESMPHLGANASGDLVESGISVFIGGRAATVLYRGRTQFPGLDQINVVVPQLDLSAYGCEVPVIIRNNAELGNPTFIPVAPSGSVCTPAPAATPGNVVSGAVISEAEINEYLSRGEVRVGFITFNRSTRLVANFLAAPPIKELLRSDIFSAGFTRYGGTGLRDYLTDLTRGPLPTALAGTCTTAPTLRTPQQLGALDPGQYLTVSGPGGVRIAGYEFTTGATHASILGDGTPGNYLDAGTYSISGPGGRDVAPFRISGPVPQVVWSNKEQTNVVRRQDGMLVTWTGGSPAEIINIRVVTYSAFGQVSAVLDCYALRSSGQFTVPAAELSRLAASPMFSGTTVVFPALVMVGTQTLVQSRVTGLDLALILAATTDSKLVELQ